MKWEYKATVLEFGNTDILQAQLNALGAEGWELVYFRDEEKRARSVWLADCIFKRECAPISLLLNLGSRNSVQVQQHAGALHEGTARQVVSTTSLRDKTIVALEWSEFIRKELVALTGQQWAVAHGFEGPCERDVRFTCYWDAASPDEANLLSMPPLSFARLLASDDVYKELKERAKHVAEARVRS